MKIICKCSSQHSPLYSLEALPNFRFFVCLAQCGGFSLSYQQCTIQYWNQSNIFLRPFFLDFSTTVHQKFIHFPRHSSAVGESNFHMVEYRIIDNISQWLNFQASSTLWSRQLHFVIVLQSLAVQVAFQFIGMKYLLCRAEQECEKMMSWGSRQAWKKFELSLISGMAAFSLSFDARSQSCQWSQWICCRRSSFLRSIEPLPYWCQLAFIQSRRAPFYSLCAVLCCCCEKHESREKKEGELARELNFTCVRVYILWNWNRGSRKRGGGGVLSLNPKFQVGTLLSDAVLFHDSSSIPPYLLWPADRHS